MPLTDRAIKNARPGVKPDGTTTDKPYRMPDEKGLYLEVRPTGGKLWFWKYRFGGREKRAGLGGYPEVPLPEARRKRDDMRLILASGVDPMVVRKTEKVSAAASAAGTFEAVASEWMAQVYRDKVSDARADRIARLLEKDVFPYLGAIPIGDITAPLLLATLRRIEARGAIPTAHRAKQACGQVFRYGIVTGRCDRDPAGELRGALKPEIVTHHAAILDPKRLGDLLRDLRAYTGQPVTRAALALAPLVFQRPGELRQAEWAEIDLDAALWTIPGARMKRTKQAKISGGAHLVPLSRQAVAILRELHPLTGRGRYVFPSLRTGERPMSENTVNAALRRIGYAADEMTGHGFRAVARTLLVERLGVDVDVVEAQLAHAVRDTLGRAYNRTEFVAQRRAMMQTWADYLDRLRDGAEVVPLRPAGGATP